MERADCVAVEKAFGEKALGVLRARGLLAKGLKVGRSNDVLLIPVVAKEEALEALKAEGIKAELCVSDFVVRRLATKEEILREIAEVEGLPRLSYHLIGNIVVLNLRSESEVEQARITASLLARHLKGVKAFFGKVGTHEEHRVPRLYHLFGDTSTFTIAREYGLSIAVDVAKAFYNPRLAEEHARVAEEMRDGMSVLDMFTGTGGFCLSVARRIEGEVFCNDLNPYAVALLAVSVALNRRSLRSPVTLLNVDARYLPELLGGEKLDAIIMNLPTRSLDFLDVAMTLLKKGGTVYLYHLGGPTEECERSFLEEELSRRAISLVLEEVREVLEHSPSKSVFRARLRRKA